MDNICMKPSTVTVILMESFINWKVVEKVHFVGKCMFLLELSYIVEIFCFFPLKKYIPCFINQISIAILCKVDLVTLAYN